MLSNESGFVFLGLAMIALGFNILGNLNKPATSVENLGLPLWRVVIASGILSAIIGVFNIIATYIFCDSKLCITGRQVRSHGAAIPGSNDSVGKTFSFSSGSTRSRRVPSPVLPTSTSPEERRKSRWTRILPINISKPIATNLEQFSKWNSRSSPVAPDVQRPPTALHPYNRPSVQPPGYPRSSTYSEVSNMNRF
jgi:hypothetical protein